MPFSLRDSKDQPGRYQAKKPELHERTVLYPSFRKYWHLIALTLLFSLLTAVFEGISIGMLIPFLKTFEEASGGAFRTGWAWLDRHVLGVGLSQMEQMYRICGIILIGTWLRAGFGYLASFSGARSRALVVEDLRMRIVDQLQAVSLRFFARERTGEILNSLTSELVRVGQSLQVLVIAISQCFLLLAYLTLMVWVSWQLTPLVSSSFHLSIFVVLIGFVRACSYTAAFIYLLEFR